MRSFVLYLTIVAFIGSVCLRTQAQDAPAKKTDKKAQLKPDKKANAKPKPRKRRPNPAFAVIKDDPNLPRVLLIGDSISIGYTVAVRELLKGKANVHRPRTNCGPTTRGLEGIEDWLGKGRWDVIHFNWGLHDLKYMGPNNENLADPKADESHQQVPPDAYAKNLEKLVQRLLKTDAKLIWRSTTPVPEGARGRVVGDSAKYNAIAAPIMKAHHIRVDDMYAYSLKRLDKIQRKADVHFTPEGSKELARHVVAAITAALPKPVEPPRELNLESKFSYPLFDGVSLHGWTQENGAQVEVKDGALLLKDGDGWLRSDHTYRDFTVHVEWKTLKEDKYDAGLYIRTLNDGSGPYPKQGYQINLLKGKEGNIHNLKGASSTGLIKPAGEWNTFDVQVIGDTVSMMINGKPAYKASGLKIPAGHVGIQVEVPMGGQFLVRRFDIVEHGYESLFDGKSLGGWSGAGGPAESCWAVVDGNIQCSGEKGPWLRTADQFGNFNFRFEYMVDKGGNSGIYVRVPENGAHHRDNNQLPEAGFEIQVLDDAAEKYSKLKDYQYCGSVYAIAPSTKHVCKPVGQWNTMEIDCDGQHVTVTHNGVRIVDADDKKFPRLALRKLSGYLGLQNHSSVVKFRRIRIGAAE